MQRKLTNYSKFKHYLLSDAFLRPAECKNLCNQEHKDVFTNDYQPNNPQAFVYHFNSLLNQLKEWGMQNQCDEKVLPQIETLKDTFFNAEYSGKQPNDFFNLIKHNLEIICFNLTSNQNIPHKKKQILFNQLCGSTFCLCTWFVYPYRRHGEFSNN